MAEYKAFMTVYAKPETIDEFRSIMRAERAKGRLAYNVLQDMIDVYKATRGAA